MRDDFPVGMKETLAKRVGNKCSNPDCGQPTSGPHEDPAKVLNIGVAAHITAASPDGPRYDDTLTTDQRKAPDNGIWLCQNHGKLVDNDAVRYSVLLLREWKRIAERLALLELERPHRANKDLAPFAKVETLMPALLDEMRKDLAADPLTREFILFKKVWSFTGKQQPATYYYEDHPKLDDEVTVLENLGCVRNVAKNDVKRFRMSEDFAEYLSSARASRDPEFKWDEAVGVWHDPKSDLRYCAKCLSDGKRSPMKNGETGFTCQVCGHYSADPKRKFRYFEGPSKPSTSWG